MSENGVICCNMTRSVKSSTRRWKEQHGVCSHGHLCTFKANSLTKQYYRFSTSILISRGVYQAQPKCLGDMGLRSGDERKQIMKQKLARTGPSTGRGWQYVLWTKMYGEPSMLGREERVKEREGRREPQLSSEVGAGERREKNGTLGTRKESREPAPGWKEMPGFIAPYYGSKEEMETAFCVGNKGIYPSPKTKGGQFRARVEKWHSRLEGNFLLRLQAYCCCPRWEVDFIPPNMLGIPSLRTKEVSGIMVLLFPR